jgi:hypothetical protein
MDVLSFVSKIGDGASWIMQKIIYQLSTWGLSVTTLQTKILLIIILATGIYLILSVLTFAKKALKWGIFGAIVFLAISILVSIFA